MMQVVHVIRGVWLSWGREAMSGSFSGCRSIPLQGHYPKGGKGPLRTGVSLITETLLAMLKTSTQTFPFAHNS